LTAPFPPEFLVIIPKCKKKGCRTCHDSSPRISRDLLPPSGQFPPIPPFSLPPPKAPNFSFFSEPRSSGLFDFSKVTPCLPLRPDPAASSFQWTAGGLYQKRSNALFHLALSFSPIGEEDVERAGNGSAVPVRSDFAGAPTAFVRLMTAVNDFSSLPFSGQRFFPLPDDDVVAKLCCRL